MSDEVSEFKTSGGHPTVIRLTLRHQRHLFDSAGKIPPDYWEPLDPGAPGTPRGDAFELCCQFDEARIWPAADKAGLRAELESLLGRGPMSAAELAAAEEEFFRAE